MIAITNVTLYTMTGGSEKGSLLVDDNGTIKALGRVNIPEGTTIIDGDGGILMPGIIDAHGHAGVAEEGLGWEGSDVNESVDPITSNLRALDGINPAEEGIREALEGGVTTMCVVPGSANVIGGEGVIIHMHGRTVDEMVIRESGGLKIAFGENPKRVYSGQKKSPATRMAIAALLREQLTKAKSYQKKWQNAEPGKEPDQDPKMDVLVRVLNKEIPLRAHAHRADDIMTAVRIAEEFDVNIVVEHCTEGHLIADILAAKGIAAVIGPTMTTRSKVELKNRTFKTLLALHEAGVKFALTMDHPVLHVQYLPLAAAFAVKEGLPREEALKALTIYPAEILGIDDHYGSLVEGKMADLVLWDGDPLDIQSRVKSVFVHGQQVV